MEQINMERMNKECMNMKRVMKLQWIQLMRNRLFYLVFLVFTMVSVMFSKLIFMPQMQDCSGGVVAVQSAPFMCDMVALYVIVNTAVLLNQDYENGSMYLMLTAGYSRIPLYFTKMIFIMMINAIMGMLLLVTPVLFHTMLYGWGDTIGIGGYALRLLLVECFLCRISALMTLLSILVKRYYLTIGGGLGLLAAEWWLVANYEIHNACVPIITAFNKIFDYDTQYNSHFTSGYVSFQITDCLNVEQQGKILLISLLMILASAIVGCIYFRMDDVQ